jgi:hypothetical protein
MSFHCNSLVTDIVSAWLVILMAKGTIAGEGAIGVLNVREAIERIMVGGKAAFNLRREKYGF